MRRRNFSAFGLTVAMTLTNLFIPKERRKEERRRRGRSRRRRRATTTTRRNYLVPKGVEDWKSSSSI